MPDSHDTATAMRAARLMTVLAVCAMLAAAAACRRSPLTPQSGGRPYEVVLTGDIDGVIIASVVPSVMYSLVNGCSKYLHQRPLIVGPGMKTGVRVRSDNPKDTGADLIANAAAVKELYGGPAIVVDYETSTSYELVLEDGTLYAVILTPGIQTSLTALKAHGLL